MVKSFISTVPDSADEPNTFLGYDGSKIPAEDVFNAIKLFEGKDNIKGILLETVSDIDDESSLHNSVFITF